MARRHVTKETGSSRREFLRRGVAAGAALVAVTQAGCTLVESGGEDEIGDAPVPKARLGKTGELVATLGLGTACLGHQNKNNPEVPKLVEVFSEAIDSGVDYVDTARIYGRAEEALKTVLATRRDKVFLVSKVWANDAAAARKSLEDSLAQLGVDSVDLAFLHSAGDKDIDQVLGPGGSWEELLAAKKAGKTRFVGLSGHSRPANFVRMIEESKSVDAMMVAMNFVDYHVYGFEDKVLPVARKHEVGVMAMKVFGGVNGGFKNYSKKTDQPSQMEAGFHVDAIRYAKSLEGVTGMVIGVHNAEQLRRNIAWNRELTPLTPAERDALRARGKEFASSWGPRFGPVV